jgi:hypothetical protein
MVPRLTRFWYSPVGIRPRQYAIVQQLLYVPRRPPFSSNIFVAVDDPVMKNCESSEMSAFSTQATATKTHGKGAALLSAAERTSLSCKSCESFAGGTGVRLDCLVRAIFLTPTGMPLPVSRGESTPRADGQGGPVNYSGRPDAPILRPYGLGVTRERVGRWCERFAWAGTAQAKAADPDVRPALSRGRPDKESGDTPLFKANEHSSASAERIVRRLKRDAPKVAADLAAGKYRSARVAVSVQVIALGQ